LADIVALNGFFTQAELVQTINRWSTDPPLPEVTDEDLTEVIVGMDQLKLFHAIEMQETAEELIEEHVSHAIKAFEEQPDFSAMDQIDRIIYDQQQELEENANGVAYLTAATNQDPHTAHDIIDEMGCTLTHLITRWFVLYMLSHETPEDGDAPIDAVRKRVSLMGMENAKAAAVTHEQLRERIAGQIERFKHMTGFYDQDEEDGEGDAPQ
jgi:hypothetical protein